MVTVTAISLILLLLILNKSSDALFPLGLNYIRNFRQSSRNWTENGQSAPVLDTEEHEFQKPVEIRESFIFNLVPMEVMAYGNPKVYIEVTQKPRSPTMNAFGRRSGTHRREHVPNHLGRTLSKVSTTGTPGQIRKKLPKSKNFLCYFTAIPCMERK